jgi:hypothetical protein
MRDAGRHWWLAAGALLVLVVAAAIGIYAGLYNIAADVPHTRPVYWLFENGAGPLYAPIGNQQGARSSYKFHPS